MRRIRFRSTVFDGAMYTLMGGICLMFGLAEHHGLALWERIGLSLLFFASGASQFIGVWRRRLKHLLYRWAEATQRQI